jgi:hypothetical protein
MRTDVHSPKNIVVEDYDFVTVRSREDDMNGFGLAAIEEFNNHRKITNGKFAAHEHGGNCNVCGAWFIDYAIFHHVPSNEYIRVGLTCAEHIQDGLSDHFKRASQIRRAAAKRKAEVDNACKILEEAGILETCEKLFKDDSFGGTVRDSEGFKEVFGFYLSTGEFSYLTSQAYTLADMVRNLIKYGSWSEKQVAYAVKIADKLENAPYEIQKREEEKANALPIVSGKQVVEGTVVSVKQQEDNFSYYGGFTWKMLVKNEKGQKFWSSIPKAIFDGVEVGVKVQYTATVDVSEKDATFGFAKRPSKAKIIEE